MKRFFYLVSFSFGAARIILPGNGLDSRDIFKDLAHVWIGGLLMGGSLCTYYKLPPRNFFWILFAILCAVEVGCAILKG